MHQTLKIQILATTIRAITSFHCIALVLVSVSATIHKIILHEYQYYYHKPTIKEQLYYNAELGTLILFRLSSSTRKHTTYTCQFTDDYANQRIIEMLEKKIDDLKRRLDEKDGK
jgi:hypothetical protein